MGKCVECGKSMHEAHCINIYIRKQIHLYPEVYEAAQ